MTVDQPTVTTKSGSVRGVMEGTVQAFRGIPFAASPIGELRLVPPQPHTGWSQIRDAARPGPAAPQGPSRLENVMGSRPPDWSEDGCLNLNVWTPNTSSAQSKPVLLWFHGGGWTSGSGGWDWYDGARLAALGDIVVITANYRLGPLGWMYLPEVGSANLGVQDQAAALRWVYDNIAAFGGDPDRITVGGQSAGAYAALSLATDPETAPLVRRVVAQSGPFGVPPLVPEKASAVTSEFLRVMDLPAPGSPDLAGRLRATPVANFIEGYRRLAQHMAQPGKIAPPMGPVLGAPGCPRPPLDAARAGALDARPILLGLTSEETTAFGVRGVDRSTADAALVGDAATDIARICATRGSEAYLYRFTRRPAPDPQRLGATHCAELPFLFGTFDAYPDAHMLGTVTTADHALARSFATAIATFVTGKAPWPAYSGDIPQAETFG